MFRSNSRARRAVTGGLDLWIRKRGGGSIPARRQTELGTLPEYLGLLNPSTRKRFGKKRESGTDRIVPRNLGFGQIVLGEG